MTIYQLKPHFQRILSPLLRWVAASGATPNQITLMALFLSMAYGVAMAWMPGKAALLWGLPVFLLVRMALNALDGMLANATAQKTRLGVLLNEMADQFSDAALYLPLALLPAVSPPLVVLVVVAGLCAEFAGVLALSLNAPRGFQGPMGKSDRAFGFGLLALLMAAGVAAIWLKTLLLGMLLLSLWTIANRVQAALRFSAPPIP